MEKDIQRTTDLIKTIVVSLVDEPDVVEVTVREAPSTTVIELKVAPGDNGKVIGRQGRVIRALRTIARASAAYGEGSFVDVEILD
ncbi:MAG: KH domain-containing protein [Coriobacteriales bacterium]|jgi:predicted RNA-binding protein YlqC (UPF0109 family)|nr:KH domain-containing protein [Coriobacteriales bacterium]